MSLKFSHLIRISSTIFIFVAINIFGLHDFYGDGFFFVLNTYDLFLFFINILFFFIVIKNKQFRRFVTQKPLRYLLYFYLFTLLVFMTMPLRGPISVLDASRVGRHYLILPLAFMIYYDVALNNKFLYYFKIFRFIAVFTSFQIILNSFNPELVSSIFKDIGRAESRITGGFQRNILLSPTMIFPHILSIFYFSKIVVEKFKLSSLFLFLLLFLAASLQGFRVYIIILAMILLLIVILFGNFHRMFLKWVFIFLLIIPPMIYVDSYFLNNQILGKFYSAYNEVIYGTGSYQGRLDNVSIRQIPMLMEKPLFGWGFIYYNSKYGKQLNIPIESERQYGLYSVDAGYVTILMQYGFIGVLIILFWYLKMLVYLYKKKDHNPPIYITAMGVIVILLFSLYTHGAFFREFGLVPLTITLGLTGKNLFLEQNRHRSK